MGGTSCCSSSLLYMLSVSYSSLSTLSAAMIFACRRFGRKIRKMCPASTLKLSASSSMFASVYTGLWSAGRGKSCCSYAFPKTEVYLQRIARRTIRSVDQTQGEDKEFTGNLAGSIQLQQARQKKDRRSRPRRGAADQEEVPQNKKRSYSVTFTSEADDTRISNRFSLLGVPNG